MRLASYRSTQSDKVCFGAELTFKQSEWLVDLKAAHAQHNSNLAQPQLEDLMPSDAIRFINGGAEQLARARHTLDSIKQLVINGNEHELKRTGVLCRVADATFLPPVPRPGKLICLGANYQAHLAEASGLPSVQQLKKAPEIPRAFSKLPSVLAGHKAKIVYPRMTKQLDYEIELALIVGKKCKNISQDAFREVIYGYTIFNDLSLRDIQYDEMAAGLILLGKNFDGAGPMGPWLVTADEIPNPHELDITLKVNGKVRQHDTTRNMMRTMASIVEYWSQMTLEPGDIITTGTPSGVAIFSDPPESYLLKPGDRIECSISKLGTLENSIVTG